MKVTHPKTGLILEAEENQVMTLVVESPDLFSEYVCELRTQVDGGDGGFIFEENEEIKADKQWEIIIDPWTIDFNSRKIKNKLYQELREKINDSEYEAFLSIKSASFMLVENASEGMSFPLSYNTTWDINALIKLMDVRIESSVVDLCERLVEYIKVLADYCGIRGLILISMKEYFAEEELRDIYREANYRKVTLLLVEGHDYKRISGERLTIIDQDKCIITI